MICGRRRGHEMSIDVSRLDRSFPNVLPGDGTLSGISALSASRTITIHPIIQTFDKLASQLQYQYQHYSLASWRIGIHQTPTVNLRLTMLCRKLKLPFFTNPHLDDTGHLVNTFPLYLAIMEAEALLVDA